MTWTMDIQQHGASTMSGPAGKTFRPEVYLKLESWVNRFGGDRAFSNRINEAPRTVRELVYSDPELMQRFGFSPPKEN